MSKIVKLNAVAELFSGQILKRVIASKDEPTAYTAKVITPKAILDDGTINLNDLSQTEFKSIIKERFITQINDIVIKLSTPYSSAVITTETAGCVISSFCAIMKCKPQIDPLYLQTYLSSSLFLNQLQKQVAGAFLTSTPIGKIGEVLLPLPAMEKQKQVGKMYIQSQERIVLMKRITALENEKKSTVLEELFNNAK